MPQGIGFDMVETVCHLQQSGRPNLLVSGSKMNEGRGYPSTDSLFYMVQEIDGIDHRLCRSNHDVVT
jgi:hypothetical protein